MWHLQTTGMVQICGAMGLVTLHQQVTVQPGRVLLTLCKEGGRGAVSGSQACSGSELQQRRLEWAVLPESFPKTGVPRGKAVF